ncbi:Cupin domain-containing protein [Paraburkholderia rhizosphaerae]|uniref:Cupin domain-containing protein n=2 Tax=Paraburkholderia rhizosphaerae TaxID=480658 RepID=A0A4R8LV70_9BURK|nr:Cupin domain-containing protein [Paraburkholderia rhizosphaerae]
MGIAEFPPNAAKPRHKATGPELCYVLEGEVYVTIEGQQTQVFHAGDTFQLPANVVHLTSAGPSGATVLAAWVHTPGKAFNVPAR